MSTKRTSRPILFYDIEVYGKDYFMVFCDESGEVKYFIHNTNEGLSKIFANYRLIGYNNHHYDDFMCIMMMRGTVEPEDVKLLNDRFIRGDITDDELRIYKRSYNKTIDTLDVSQQIEGSSIDMRTRKRYPPSLKLIMANKGHNIHESEISFDYPFKLTDEQLQECVDYCINDVRETIPIYLNRKSYFDTKEYTIGLLIDRGEITDFQFNQANKWNQTTITGMLVGELDPWVYSVDHLKVPDCWRQHWNLYIGEQVKPSLRYEAFGNIIDVSFGGIHGFNPNLRKTDKIYHIDVGGMYPNLLIRDKILGGKTSLLEGFVKRRDEIKYLAEKLYKEDGDKDEIQALEAESTNIKVGVNNSLYGILNSKYSVVFNPPALFQICANGHESIYNLALRLSKYGEIAQINTDGIYFVESRPGWNNELPEWEEEFKLSVDVDEYKFYHAQHISRYIVVDSKGKIKTKGMNDKADQHYKNNNFAIVDKCIVEYCVNGIDPMDTILDNANNLIFFQYVTKFGRQFSLVERHIDGDESKDVVIGQKVNRFFVTSDNKDSDYVIRKRKKIPVKEVMEPIWEEYVSSTGNLRRRRIGETLVIKNYQYTSFSDLPENITLFNGDLENITQEELSSLQLDYGFYYDLACRKLKLFLEGGNK